MGDLPLYVCRSVANHGKFKLDQDVGVRILRNEHATNLKTPLGVGCLGKDVEVSLGCLYNVDPPR